MATQQDATSQIPQSRSSTSATHRLSHAVVQQYGSAAHTHSMMSASLHPGVVLAWQQGPLPSHQPQSSGQSSQPSLPVHLPSPHLAQVPQSSESTSCTHRLSHAVSQQYGSAAQTHASTPSSLQPGVWCATQQPSTLQMPQFSSSTSLTQSWSHSTWQQNGSASHTHSMMAGSSHPGVSLTAQQSPSPGHQPQSWGHSSHVSAPVHSPSPHSAHVPQSSVSTSSTHRLSHAVSQQ